MSKTSLPLGRTRSRRTGRPPISSRETLLAAGWEIGIGKLTIGQVTEAVGIKYSTFYRYFANHEAFIAALIDDAFSREGEPGHVDADPAQTIDSEAHADAPSRPGRAARAIDRAARRLHHVLDHHPGLASILVARPWPAPPVAALRDSLVEHLTAAGTPEQPAVAAADLLVSSIVFAHLTDATQTSRHTHTSEISHTQLVLITTAVNRYLQ